MMTNSLYKKRNESNDNLGTLTLKVTQKDDSHHTFPGEWLGFPFFSTDTDCLKSPYETMQTKHINE